MRRFSLILLLALLPLQSYANDNVFWGDHITYQEKAVRVLNLLQGAKSATLIMARTGFVDSIYDLSGASVGETKNAIDEMFEQYYTVLPSGEEMMDFLSYVIDYFDQRYSSGFESPADVLFVQALLDWRGE